jgi:accessory secretory protein asp1
VDYFLSALKPWNESLVYSVEKIQVYTGHRLVDMWEGWMRD